MVDDSEDMLEVLKRNLTMKGYTVYTSHNVADAIDILERTVLT